MIASMTERTGEDDIQASDEGWGHFVTFTQERGEAMMGMIKTWLDINMKNYPELGSQPIHVPDIGEFMPEEIIVRHTKNRSK